MYLTIQKKHKAKCLTCHGKKQVYRPTPRTCNGCGGLGWVYRAGQAPKSRPKK